MHVHSFELRRVSVSSYRPAARVVFVAVGIDWDYVHENDVRGFWVQASHFHFYGREHSSRKGIEELISLVQQLYINIRLSLLLNCMLISLSF